MQSFMRVIASAEDFASLRFCFCLFISRINHSKSCRRMIGNYGCLTIAANHSNFVGSAALAEVILVILITSAKYVILSLFVFLFVSRIRRKLLNPFSQKSVGRWQLGQGRND